VSGANAATAAVPHLRVSLGVEPDGVPVGWRLDGVSFEAGEPFAMLPLSIAGAPTLELGDDALAAADDAGGLRLVRSVEDDGDGDPVHLWRIGRASVGPVEVTYLARPDTDEPRPATPPIELRREGAGLSGALKCFLVLPVGREDLPFELRWEEQEEGDFAAAWTFVSSLGEGPGRDGELSGTGLELLGDTYVMCGDLATSHHRDGPMSTWWLTPPGLDVEAFTARLGTTYDVMATAFDAPAHAYRVFLRTHPHRGANASAHPASFVMAMNPADMLEESKVYETIAHELVHEWLRLDGPVDEVTWFVEGAADYYSLVLPLRQGILEEDAFLRAVNHEARTGYANPRRHLTLKEASPLFFSDFLAHRLPYVRGMFYLADLDARLRDATSDARSVDDVVRDVVRRRREGHLIGVGEWCALVDEVLPGDERLVLDALVFTGVRRPGPGTFGPRFELTEVHVPVLDVGFDPSTFVTRRVRGLVPGGLADRAGLREDDQVELPSYPEALALSPDDVLDIRVDRDGEASVHTIPLAGRTIPVPQWRTRKD
jgi:predicted metalloprotease with PDZ domain